ncbi:MAG TPA: hypothetical protein DDY78_03735 [Planctomycetales bacterium]|jgi:hypothetical protein|nr:hypothetical protein [Planctomycetales bacterium]
MNTTPADSAPDLTPVGLLLDLGEPLEMLVEGGFTTLEDMEQAERDGVNVLGPIKNEESKKAKGEGPYQPKKNDGPGVGAWRQRIGTAAAKETYKLRAATAERVNAGARQRGMYRATVRGRQKVLAVALLQALVHNLRRTVALRAAQTAAVGAIGDRQGRWDGVGSAYHDRHRLKRHEKSASDAANVGCATLVLCYLAATGS